MEKNERPTTPLALANLKKRMYRDVLPFPEQLVRVLVVGLAIAYSYILLN